MRWFDDRVPCIFCREPVIVAGADSYCVVCNVGRTSGLTHGDKIRMMIPLDDCANFFDVAASPEPATTTYYASPRALSLADMAIVFREHAGLRIVRDPCPS